MYKPATSTSKREFKLTHMYINCQLIFSQEKSVGKRQYFKQQWRGQGAAPASYCIAKFTQHGYNNFKELNKNFSKKQYEEASFCSLVVLCRSIFFFQYQGLNLEPCTHIPL